LNPHINQDAAKCFGENLMTRKQLSLFILIPFTILSLYAVSKVLLLSWIIPEAKRRGINPWPYVAITVCLGSFGPLFYLAIHGSESRSS